MIGQILQSEGQAQGIEFPLLVSAVDRGDIHGDMAFVIDVLPGPRTARAKG